MKKRGGYKEIFPRNLVENGKPSSVKPQIKKLFYAICHTLFCQTRLDRSEKWGIGQTLEVDLKKIQSNINFICFIIDREGNAEY